MSIKEQPKIEESKENTDFTLIKFEPDLKKFNMDCLDDDIISLMKKRVIDIAGVTHSNVSVFLNDKKLQVKNFKDYINYYFNTKESVNGKDESSSDIHKLYDSPNNRWEVMLSPSDTCFTQVSFCNSICTSKGGTHVNYIMDQVIRYIIKDHIK